MSTEIRAGSRQRDDHVNPPESVRGLTNHIADLIGDYRERVSAFNNAVETAERMSKERIEPFLESLIADIAEQGIIARLLVQKGPDEEDLYPRRVSMVIDKINGTEFTDVNSTPTFLFICSGNRGGSINISSYAPNAGRFDLGKIPNNVPDIEKSLEEYLMKGFERLFRAL